MAHITPLWGMREDANFQPRAAKETRVKLPESQSTLFVNGVKSDFRSFFTLLHGPWYNIRIKKGLSGVLVTYFSLCDIQPVPSTPQRYNTLLGALLLAGPRS